MSFMPTIAANRPGKRNAACGLPCISRPAVLPSATTCPCQDLIFDKLSANPIKKRLKYNISGMTNTAYVFEGHSSSSKKSRNWFASDDHDAFSLILRYVSAVTAQAVSPREAIWRTLTAESAALMTREAI